MKVTQLITRICPRCSKELPIEQFYKQAKAKYGRGGYCKECSRITSAEYAHNNPEKIKIIRDRFKENHPSYDCKRDKLKVANNRRKSKKKQRVQLSDSYVKAKLYLWGEIPEGLLRAKREQLLIHRLSVELKKELSDARKAKNTR